MVARWGAGDLGALTGAQSVLGPAVAVGPTSGAVSAGLAAAAIVLATPLQRPSLRADWPEVSLTAGACGAAGALVGCGPGDDPLLRAVAVVVAITAAVVSMRTTTLARRHAFASAAGAVAAALAWV